MLSISASPERIEVFRPVKVFVVEQPDRTSDANASAAHATKGTMRFIGERLAVGLATDSCLADQSEML